MKQIVYSISIGEINRPEPRTEIKDAPSHVIASHLGLEFCKVLFKIAVNHGSGKIQTIDGNREVVVKWRTEGVESDTLPFTRTTERIRHEVNIIP